MAETHFHQAHDEYSSFSPIISPCRTSSASPSPWSTYDYNASWSPVSATLGSISQADLRPKKPAPSPRTESANEKEVYQPPPEVVHVSAPSSYPDEKNGFNSCPMAPVNTYTLDLPVADGFSYSAPKGVESYKRGATHHPKGLRLRYVCRVECCGQTFKSASVEKKHFSSEHIRPHECKLCRQRFKSPKRVWQHLQKTHRLNLPEKEKPRHLGANLGCPCCCKTAADRLAEENPIGQILARPLNQQIGNPVSSKPTSAPRRSGPKLWPSDSIKKLKNLRPKNKTSDKASVDQDPCDAGNASSKPKDKSGLKKEERKKNEGFLMVTTDQRKFVGVSLTGLETPRALLSKITAAVNLSDIHFPDTITVQTFSPRYGAGKKLNDVQALANIVDDTLAVSGSLILYVSTSLLSGDRLSRLDDDRLSSTLVASSHDYPHACGSDAGGEKWGKAKIGKKIVDDVEDQSRRLSMHAEDQASEYNWRRTSSIQRTIDEVVRPAKLHNSQTAEIPSPARSTTVQNHLEGAPNTKPERNDHAGDLAPSFPSSGRASLDAEQTAIGFGHDERREATLSHRASFVSCDDKKDVPISTKGLAPSPSNHLRSNGSLLDYIRGRWRTFEQPVSPVYDPYSADFVKSWLDTITAHGDHPSLASLDTGSPPSLSKWREATLDTLSLPFRRRTSSDKAAQLTKTAQNDPGTRRRNGWLAQALIKARETSKAETSPTGMQRSTRIEMHHYIHQVSQTPVGQDNLPVADAVQERPGGAAAGNGSNHARDYSSNKLPSPSPQQYHRPQFGGRESHEPRRDDEDGNDDRQNPKRRRIDPPGNGNVSNGRLPCIHAVADPSLYPCHDKKFKYISQLLRHLNSHGFYACSKCFAKFEDEDQEEAHRNHGDCSKACKDRKCLRARPAGSGTLPSRCESGCIRTPEQQWAQLFKLQYPDREVPAIFPTIRPVIMPGMQQVSPITTSSGTTIPSPVERSNGGQQQFGMNGPFEHRRGNVSTVPTIVTDSQIFQEMGEGFDIDPLPPLLNIPPQALGGGEASSSDSSPVEANGSWTELQFLREKTKGLEKELQVREWQLSQLDPRAEVLEEMLGKVWRALVSAQSPNAKPYTPLWLEMKRLAPQIVQQRSVLINNAAGGQMETIFQPSNNDSGSSLGMFDLPAGESSTTSLEDLGYGSMSTVQNQQMAQAMGDMTTVDPKLLQIPVNG